MPKVIIEQEQCIGCGTCENLCSEYFKLGDGMKARLIKGKKNGAKYELEITKVEPCIKDAIKNCPVECIHIK